MTRFLTHWLTTAVALGAASWILPGVTVSSATALLVAALVLGFVNAVVRPVLVLMTLPFTLVTLGLFYFVVNGLAFGLAAWLVPGVRRQVVRVGDPRGVHRWLGVVVYRRIRAGTLGPARGNPTAVATAVSAGRVGVGVVKAALGASATRWR